MKKTTLFMLLLMCISGTVAFSQNIYFKAGAGYAFPMPGQTADQYGNQLNGSYAQGVNSADYQLHNASYSSGVHGLIGFGYMFSRNIGVELNADMNLASKKYTIVETGLTNGNTAYNYTAIRQAKNNVLLLPSLVLQTANEKWNLYMRMGLALPVSSGINMKETAQYVQTGNVVEYNWKIKNYFSLGFTAATGINVRLSERVSLWVEYSILYMALSRKERIMQDAVANGIPFPVSTVTATTGSPTHYSYSKNGHTQFDQQHAFSQPFSNMALNIGISYDLKKSKGKTTTKTHKVHKEHKSIDYDN